MALENNRTADSLPPPSSTARQNEGLSQQGVMKSGKSITLLPPLQQTRGSESSHTVTARTIKQVADDLLIRHCRATSMPIKPMRVSAQTPSTLQSRILHLLPSLTLSASSRCICALLQLPQALQGKNATEASSTCHALFTALKTALAADPNPTLQAHYQAIERNPLTQVMRQPGWKWKSHHATLTATDAANRAALVGHICAITDVLAKREGIIRPSTGWEAFGTAGVTSDIDQGVCVVKNTRFPLADNVVQGQVVCMASLVWRALMGGTSLAQGDIEFYPPHVAGYLELGLLPGEITESNTTAHYAAQFMQFRLQLHDETEWATYKKQVLKRFTNPEELATMRALFTDIEDVHKQTQQIKAIWPSDYQDMNNTIMCNELSKQIQTVARKLDLLKTQAEILPPPSGAKLKQIKEKRQLLLQQFHLLLIAQETFIPEGYIGQGAFAVICKNQGGQQHVMSDLELENAVRGGKPISKSGARIANSLENLLGSVGENAAYFLHRNDLIDGSKYGLRVYNAALQSLQKLKDLVRHSPKTTQNGQLLAEMHALEQSVASHLDEMSVLEGSKRKKWDRVSLITTAILMQKKEARLQLEAAIRRMTGEIIGPMAENDEEAIAIAEVQAEKRERATAEKKKILGMATPKEIVAAYAQSLNMKGITALKLSDVTAVQAAMQTIEKWQALPPDKEERAAAIQKAKEELWAALMTAALQVGNERIESALWRDKLASAISDWFIRNTPGSPTFAVLPGVSTTEVAGRVQQDFSAIYRNANHTPFQRAKKKASLRKHAIARLAPPLALQGAVLHVARAAIASSLTDNAKLQQAIQERAKKSLHPTTDIVPEDDESEAEILSQEEQVAMNKERSLGAAKDLSIPIQATLARQTMKQMIAMRTSGSLLKQINHEIVETHILLMDLANRAHAIKAPVNRSKVTMASSVRSAAVAVGAIK